ncbi:MAG: bifunctional demethylmenaquinone methyltransferase/2-methoxy-6-polyprenyl-1,4-benzoquinol methylase UbiE [Bacteroidota bacterium]|nr:bifunctional demethylmenaquinone methyltransferase/2-methoxy-6-polyprenyl-1,4-benzoquinol methylase UbiE [Bacteroidota bacterium]
MIVPYKNQKSGKKEQIANMFNSIARRYDFLNHFLSLGIDKFWRKRAIKYLLNINKESNILDVATGTGDLAIIAAKLNPKKIVGVDISEEMLVIGREKVAKKSLSDKIILLYGDSEKLEFPDNEFHAAMVAFGVRNFENLSDGIQEIYRVLKANRNFVVLEFSKPNIFPVKQLYNFYFKTILPFIGRFFSKDDSAYSYLPESVKNFPDNKEFIKLLEKSGFRNCSYNRLTFGIVTIYVGTK